MSNLNQIIKHFNILERFSEVRMPIAIPNANRESLALLFGVLGFNRGAEIGVEQGVYSEVLLKSNSELSLSCIDAWKAHRGYRDHTRQEKLDRFFSITKERLQPYQVELIRLFSMEAVKYFEDESLDFVYIDANHDFINVTQDIYYWSKKVKKGGIVSGHDYVKRKNEAAHVHVKQVLQGYTDAYNITPWFVLGADEKIAGQLRDDTRSWFFVKE